MYASASSKNSFIINRTRLAPRHGPSYGPTAKPNQEDQQKRHCDSGKGSGRNELARRVADRHADDECDVDRHFHEYSIGHHKAGLACPAAGNCGKD